MHFFHFLAQPIVTARPKIENYIKGPVNPKNTLKVFSSVQKRIREEISYSKFEDKLTFIDPRKKVNIETFVYYWFHISHELVEKSGNTSDFSNGFEAGIIRECMDDAIRALSNHIRIDTNPELRMTSNRCYKLHLCKTICTKNAFGRPPININDALFSISDFSRELELSGIEKPFYKLNNLEIRHLPRIEREFYKSIAPDGSLPDQPLALLREFFLFLDDYDSDYLLGFHFDRGDKKEFNNYLITIIKNFLKLIIAKYNLSMDEPEVCKQCQTCRGYGQCTLANGKPPVLNHKEKVLVQFCKPIAWNPKSKKS